MQRVKDCPKRFIAPLLVPVAFVLVANTAVAQNVNIQPVPPAVMPTVPTLPSISTFPSSSPSVSAPETAVVPPPAAGATVQDRLGGCPEGPPCPDDETHAGKEKAP